MFQHHLRRGRPPALDCAEVRRQLTAYAGGDLASAEQTAIRAHLQTCPACAQAAREALAFDTEVRGLAAGWQPRLSPHASSRIQANVYQRMRSSLVWQRSLRFAAQAAAVVVLVGAAAAFYGLWQTHLRPLVRVPVVIPGGHLWAAEQHDAQGTFWVDMPPLKRPAVAWEHTEPGGLQGGPLVAADGSLYVLAGNGQLLALTPSGAVTWRAALPDKPVGTPSLGASGHVYVAGSKGTLTAVSPAGQLAWTVTAGPDAAIASPIAGPDETIYFATASTLVAVTADGQVRWRVPLPTYSYISALPRLSPDGRHLFFADTALEASSGQRIFGPTWEAFDAFVVGADGKVYLHQTTRFYEWRLTPETIEIIPVIQPPQAPPIEFPFPLLAGVTRDGQGWFYLSGGSGDLLAWLHDDEMDTSGLREASTFAELAGDHIVAVDRSQTVYSCSFQLTDHDHGMTCQARRAGADSPTWQLVLDSPSYGFQGGALVPGRLYVTTSTGQLFALSDGRP